MARKASKPPGRALGRAGLARWSRPVRTRLVLVSILNLAGLAGWAGFAFAFAEALSEGVRGETPGLTAGLGICALAFRAVCLWLSDRMSTHAGRIAASAARREVAIAFQTSGAAFVTGMAPGEVSSRIVDRSARLAGWVSGWIPGMRQAILGPMLILGVAASQSVVVALILFVSLAALPVFIWLTASETVRVAAAEQAALETLAGSFQSRTACAGTLRAFRAVGRERDLLSRLCVDLETRTLAVLRSAFLSGAVLEFFSAVSVALAAVYVGFSLLGIFPIDTGETLTLREGMTLLVIAPEFFAPVRRLSALHHERAAAVSAAEVLSEWIEKAPAPGRRLEPLAEAPYLRFSQADVARSSGRTGAKGVDFEARPGEIIALVGPSGSGKTACLLALLGLASVERGGIYVNGRMLRPGESLADSVGYVPQTPWSGGGDLAADLRLAAPEAGDQALVEALQRVGLGHLGQASDQGLKRQMGRSGETLSGGERQKLALARILIGGRRILLLDEPTAHLDEASEASFLKVLRDLAPGRTILLTTHRPKSAQAADHIVRLEPSGGVRLS